MIFEFNKIYLKSASLLTRRFFSSIPRFMFIMSPKFPNWSLTSGLSLALYPQ